MKPVFEGICEYFSTKPKTVAKTEKAQILELKLHVEILTTRWRTPTIKH